MSAHFFFIEFIKQVKKACQTFYHFFATSLINSIIQEHACNILYIIFDIKTILKSHFLA